jgi:hypothetical protein
VSNFIPAEILLYHNAFPAGRACEVLVCLALRFYALVRSPGMGCRLNIVLSLVQAQLSLGVAQGVLGLRGCFLPMPSDTHLLVRGGYRTRALGFTPTLHRNKAELN